MWLYRSNYQTQVSSFQCNSDIRPLSIHTVFTEWLRTIRSFIQTIFKKVRKSQTQFSSHFRCLLTHFKPMLNFYTLRKRQKKTLWFSHLFKTYKHRTLAWTGLAFYLVEFSRICLFCRMTEYHWQNITRPYYAKPFSIKPIRPIFLKKFKIPMVGHFGEGLVFW